MICEICGRDRFKKIEEFRHSADVVCDYVACLHCGHVSMNPVPSDSCLKDFYNESFWQDSKGVDYSIRKQGMVAQKTIDYLDKVLSPNFLVQCRRILDVGSSFGVCLHHLRGKAVERGCLPEFYGIELSTYAIEKGASFYKDVQVLNLDISEFHVDDKKFDLIIASNVLEHVVSPVKTLRILQAALSDTGYLYVEVPNYFGHPSVGVSHLQCFTPSSLRNLLLVTGFHPVSFDTYYRDPDFPLFLTTLCSPSTGNTQLQAIQTGSYEDVLKKRTSAKKAFIRYKSNSRLHSFLRAARKAFFSH